MWRRKQKPERIEHRNYWDDAVAKMIEETNDGSIKWSIGV